MSNDVERVVIVGGGVIGILSAHFLAKTAAKSRSSTKRKSAAAAREETAAWSVPVTFCPWPSRGW